MTVEDNLAARQAARQAIRKARKISAMVQGTMGLEGQGLDPKFLYKMKKETVRSLLAGRR